jgi:hypothetical protein
MSAQWGGLVCTDPVYCKCEDQIEFYNILKHKSQFKIRTQHNYVTCIVWNNSLYEEYWIKYKQNISGSMQCICSTICFETQIFICIKEYVFKANGPQGHWGIQNHKMRILKTCVLHCNTHFHSLFWSQSYDIKLHTACALFRVPIYQTLKSAVITVHCSLHSRSELEKKP